ncbi:MAG: hypothetical protein A2946_02830 [Candidatus Liptonbacteria bacterium RIFCSPLOWO2_01_FULL_53_13]|uniref:Uncharacterized protein n=1 Tax=Candidatus Liptonbacteria bacterium RIFCSPLOWO2_01_FULL_53_13 TaxID=1798651 RepID=A0A1G2CNS5_9BACT|nr:MAG: hypothetical protein A2946_02830 [Candidatus Liptonbacteria bacterium RIFCSPLOWO2_01_FULL_53_13]
MAKKTESAIPGESPKAQLKREIAELPENRRGPLVHAIRWRRLGIENERRCRGMLPDDEELLALYERAIEIFLSSKGGAHR